MRSKIITKLEKVASLNGWQESTYCQRRFNDSKILQKIKNGSIWAATLENVEAVIDKELADLGYPAPGVEL